MTYNEIQEKIKIKKEIILLALDAADPGLMSPGPSGVIPELRVSTACCGPKPNKIKTPRDIPKYFG